jgi:DNA-directed RNA polymerase subunit RPC12/RpoP
MGAMSDKTIPLLDGWEAFCELCQAFREARCAQEHDIKTGSEYFEFVCKTCHSILLTFQRLGTQSEESKPQQLTATARCPHCGDLNVFPGFTQILVYICSHCGQSVDASLAVQ